MSPPTRIGFVFLDTDDLVGLVVVVVTVDARHGGREQATEPEGGRGSQEMPDKKGRSNSQGSYAIIPCQLLPTLKEYDPVRMQFVVNPSSLLTKPRTSKKDKSSVRLTTGAYIAGLPAALLDYTVDPFGINFNIYETAGSAMALESTQRSKREWMQCGKTSLA